MWIIWYFLLVIVSALFEGVLAAIMRLDKYELARRARLGSERAQAISPLRQRGRELALMFMLGSVLSGLGALAVATTHMQLWSALLLTTLLVVFSRLIARSALQGKGYKIAKASSSQLLTVLDLVAPAVQPLSALLMQPSQKSSPDFFSKDELLEILSEHTDGPDTNLKQEDIQIARSALQFSDKVVRQVMTARDLVMTVKPTRKLNLALLDELHGSGYSYFPISGDKLDSVSGMMHIDQAIHAQGSAQRVSDLDLHEPLYMTNDTKLPVAVSMMRDSGLSCALVVDEHSEIIGLVTARDLIDDLIASGD